MVRISNLSLVLVACFCALVASQNSTSYSQDCIDVTQPPFFVKIWLYFHNGWKWTSDEEFTAQSIGSYGRCCNGTDSLPGDCKCPLANNSTDPEKYQEFVDAMYGTNETTGWCSDVKDKCGL